MDLYRKQTEGQPLTGNMCLDLVYTLVQDLGQLGQSWRVLYSMKKKPSRLTPFSPLADAPKCGCFHLAWKPFSPFFTSCDICHQNGMSLICFLALRCTVVPKTKGPDSPSFMGQKSSRTKSDFRSQPRRYTKFFATGQIV